VVRLQEELDREELRAEAAEILRSLISEARLVQEGGKLEVELAGDLAGILALTSGSKKPVTMGRDGLQVTLVAGVGFEPTTFRL
jgi:site-specific DNA recombinase